MNEDDQMPTHTGAFWQMEPGVAAEAGWLDAQINGNHEMGAVNIFFWKAFF